MKAAIFLTFFTCLVLIASNCIEPQLVIDAIRQVVEAVRGGDRQLARQGLAFAPATCHPVIALRRAKTADCLSVMHHHD